MRRFLGAGLVTLFLATSVFAQADRSAIHTNPVPPPREALERLNLTMAWRTFVQMDGKRDGIVSIRTTGKHLLIQTRSGLVTQLNAETGQALWRNRVGTPYQLMQPLTFNSASVFVLNNNYLYGLDRNDGSIQYQMGLPGGISAPPIADDDTIYMPTVAGRLQGYRLPNMEAEKEAQRLLKEEAGKSSSLTTAPDKPTDGYDSSRSKLAPPAEGRRMGPQPVEVMSVSPNMRMDYQPLLGSDTVALVSSGGKLVAFSKPSPSGAPPQALYRFEAEGEVVAPPGHFEDTVYLGSQDANVYAIEITSGRVIWRHTAGSSVNRQPFATREDLFVSSERNGLARLRRATGDTLWSIPRGKRVLTSQPDLDRILAVNPKYVYATDRSGRLAVIDRIRGTILSTYDLHEWVVLTPNEWTDRLYLAAQNGLVICLHDREYALPYEHRQQEHSLLGKLKRPFNTVPIFDRPLKDVLRELGIENRVKIMLSTRAFKDQALDAIDAKPVKLERLDGSTSLREGLEKLLAPFGAVFEPIDETIIIVPKANKGGDNPADKDKPPEKEKDKEKPKDGGMNM